MKNFRFHEDTELEIPDTGFTLLSGVSGKGKTTVLNAIIYSFYGHIRSPYTHDKTTCSVDLEYKKDGRTVNISRSSHPNTLNVKYKKQDYEGDAAQGVIEQILGTNYDVFMTSSYIAQQTNKSVLFMTPCKQLDFVETLTFNTDDHSQYKRKCKAYTKECQNKVIKREEQVVLLKSQWLSSQESMKDAYGDRDDIPDLGDIDPNHVKTEVQDVKKSMNSLEKESVDLNDTLEELQEEEDTKKTLVEEKKRLETELTQLKKMKGELGSVKLDDEFDKLEKKILKSKRLLEHTRAYESYFESLSNVDRMEEEHFKDIKLQVKELKKKVPDEKKMNTLERSYQEAKKEVDEESQGAEENMKNKIKREEAVETVKRIFKEVKKLYDTKVKKPSSLLEYLQKEKEEALGEQAKENESIEANNKLLIQKESMKKVYQCPKCSCKLAVFDESLVIPEELPKVGNIDKVRKCISDSMNMVNTLNGELTQLDVWLKDLDEAIPSYKLKVEDNDSSIREGLEKLEKELKAIENAKEKINSLLEQIKNRDIPSSLRKIKDEIETNKKFPDNFKPRNSIKELEEEIQKLATEIESSKRAKGDHSSMSREINTRQEKLKKINKRLGHDRKVPQGSDVDSIENIRKKLTDVRKKMMSSAKRLAELQEDLEIISKYDAYQKDASRVKELKTNFKQAEIDLKSAGKDLEAAHGLEQTVKEAEILAMEKTLANINGHARTYLENIFPEPITIRLENRKDISKSSKNKETKLQMNTVVFYRGKKYNSVDELSGGEKQRCNLAFLLAANSMCSSPFLFLDECLNNLDGSMNMDILSYLRGVADNKLILVVSHEAIEGNFDSIVSL